MSFLILHPFAEKTNCSDALLRIYSPARMSLADNLLSIPSNPWNHILCCGQAISDNSGRGLLKIWCIEILSEETVCCLSLQMEMFIYSNIYVFSFYLRYNNRFIYGAVQVQMMMSWAVKRLCLVKSCVTQRNKQTAHIDLFAMWSSVRQNINPPESSQENAVFIYRALYICMNATGEVTDGTDVKCKGWQILLEMETGKNSKPEYIYQHL